MLVQHRRLAPASPASASRVESDVLAVVREGQLLSVPGPGVARDGRGAETVNLGHGDEVIRGSWGRGLWAVYTVGIPANSNFSVLLSYFSRKKL